METDAAVDRHHSHEEPGNVPSVGVAEGKKLSRSERKRRETREKIISAADELMRSKPLDEITIAEITEVADVGHGTFYLHFKTKHEVVVPLFQLKTRSWDESIHALADVQTDPAAAVARSTRYIARKLVADPLCRWFLQDSGFPADDVREALGQFVARDIEAGLEAGRFSVPDTELTLWYMIGGVVTALLSIFDEEDPEAHIDCMAELMLRVLGISDDEARELAHKPLPKSLP